MEMITWPGLPEAVPVPSLARWGLSPDADLVYRALVTLGVQPVAILRAVLGLPTPRVLAACEELHGSAVAFPVSAGWQVLPPAETVARLRRLWILRRQQPRTAPDGPAEVLRFSGAEVRADAPGLQILRGLDAVRDRIGTLMAAERVEHLAMNPERVTEASTVAAAAPHDLALLARNIRLRVLNRPPTDGDICTPHVDQLGQLGAELRTSGSVPTKLMIFDRRVALMPLDPADLTVGAVQLETPVVVDALVTLFQQCWANGRDPRVHGVSEVELTERERALVTLLGQGHTDETAARHLGVSPRTVSSTLRGLMDRLGVDSRFALGLALGRRTARIPPQREQGDKPYVP